MKLKRGEMGMGTLIVFIAMILVAAVAASVLISTTGSLQNKALDTGRSTRQEVGTSIQIVETYAQNGSDTDIEEFVHVIKLNAGSDNIRFSDVLLNFYLNNESAEYTYNATIDCNKSLYIENDVSGDTTTAGLDYGIGYAITGPNNKTGYLTRGDVAKICFEAPRKVVESELVRIQLVPKVGTVSIMEATTPNLMISQRIAIFP